MGTRGLTVVIADGEHKVAQYGQWDHYPGGQGVTALNFLLTEGNRTRLLEAVKNIRFITPEDEQAAKDKWAELGADVDTGWVTLEQAREFEKDPRFTPLSRDHGAGILEMVADGKVEFLRDDLSFGEDGLFCEYAYVVDLDKGTFEVYEGFNKTAPIDGLWAGHKDEDSDYGAVHRIAVYDLDNLPNSEDFCKELEPDDED